MVAKEIYGKNSPESAGLRAKEIEGKSFSQMVKILSKRLDTLQSELHSYDSSKWQANFIQQCESRHKELEAVWKASWITHDSGKRLIDDIYKKYTVKVSKLSLKRRLAKRIKMEETEDWTLVKSKIRDALSDQK